MRLSTARISQTTMGALCALCFFVCIASAQTTTSAGSPARLRLDSLEGLTAKASETVDVSLDGAALRLATQAASDNEILKNLPPQIDRAQVRELLASLQAVYVRVYEFKQPGGYTDANIEPVLTQLRASGSGWSRLFSVNEPGAESTKVDFFAANDPARNDHLSGLALIVREPKQLVVGYVVGTINTDTVMKLMDIFKKMHSPNPQGKQTPPPAKKP